MAIALFPGSFDPFTAGHEAILRRVAPLFDRVVVAVGVNTEKRYMFSVEERLERIRRTVGDIANVEVTYATKWGRNASSAAYAPRPILNMNSW